MKIFSGLGQEVVEALRCVAPERPVSPGMVLGETFLLSDDSFAARFNVFLAFVRG